MLAVFYHLLCFADLVQDGPTRLKVGWSMIASLSCFLGFNFTLVLKELVCDLLLKLKAYLRKRKQAKQQARREKIDEGREKQMLQYYADQKREQLEESKQQPLVLESIPESEQSGSKILVRQQPLVVGSPAASDHSGSRILGKRRPKVLEPTPVSDQSESRILVNAKYRRAQTLIKPHDKRNIIHFDPQKSEPANKPVALGS